MHLLRTLSSDYCLALNRTACNRTEKVVVCTPDLLRLKEEEKGMPGTQKRPPHRRPLAHRGSDLGRLNLAMTSAKRLEGLAPPKYKCCPNYAHKSMAFVYLWKGTSCLETHRVPAGEPGAVPR